MKDDVARTEHVYSAGGAVIRRRPGAVEVALISVAAPRRWQLPKGKLDPGETSAQAARREVREEAGLVATIVERLDTIEYWFQQGRGARAVRFHKRVTFYLMRYESGDVGDHDDEVHEAKWFPLELAITELHYPSERRVLEAARDRLWTLDARPRARPPRPKNERARRRPNRSVRK